MPIIEMVSERDGVFPEGAFASLYWTKQVGRPIYLRETHAGLCLMERERNMRDDSDFFMLVWDEETQKPREIMFASTRGWTYPCMDSHKDATDEVRRKYAAFLQDEVRRQEAERIAMLERRIALWATECSITVAQVNRLREIYGEREHTAIFWLLSANVRNQMKVDFARKIREWLNQEQPKYPTPMSKKQLACVVGWYNQRG